MKGIVSHLGQLSNPSFHTEHLVLPQLPKHELVDMLRQMIVIRRAEEIIADLIQSQEVRCPCHLGIGQEAIAVGVLTHFGETDRVFGTHRAHAHFLSMGGTVYELFAEVMGKATGCSGGLGGSQHLYAAKTGFLGSLPIVGGTIPIAVGAALAAKMDGKQAISACFFGDGAAEEGGLHESLNLAAIYQLPVLFVCENNFYSSHLDICLRQPSDRIARFAEAHHVETLVVDGNDLFAVSAAAAQLTEMMRRDRKPAFLEVITYRWRGHVGPDENVDVGLRRKEEDLLAWKMRDPIRRLADGLVAADYLTKNEYTTLQEEIEMSMQKDLMQAKSDPYPSPDKLLHGVYAEVK